ncbi:MAG TPA: DUF6279 family lipoprotein [Gammaproteobacteria bacterium]
MKTAVLACLLGLTACSGTTFVYNRLDTILPWYVDDYVELNASQERQLEGILRPFLDWHRQQELPRYVELLNQVDCSLDHEVTPAELANIYDEMQVAWLRLEQESLDGLLELGESLSDAQVQEFLAYMWKRQDEYEEEYLTRSGSEYREEIYENFADTLEDYLGRLTAEQKDRLRQATADFERADEVWLQERAASIERLAVILRREPGWQEQVREAVKRRAETVSPRYQQVYQHNLAAVFAAVAGVLNSRTERQDRYLREELAGLREDLETLIAQGIAAPPDSA